MAQSVREVGPRIAVSEDTAGNIQNRPDAIPRRDRIVNAIVACRVTDYNIARRCHVEATGTIACDIVAVDPVTVPDHFDAFSVTAHVVVVDVTTVRDANPGSVVVRGAVRDQRAGRCLNTASVILSCATPLDDTAETRINSVQSVPVGVAVRHDTIQIHFNA